MFEVVWLERAVNDLAAIWVQCRDEVLLQAGVVGDAIADALAGELTPASRDAAGHIGGFDPA